MIGHSPVFRAVVDRLLRIASARSPVLISGETGTGKEVAAKYLHAQSGRTGPFVAVNCAAFPDALIEAELFGHEKGAFTGAVGKREGKFRAAQKGTLFLDEIGESSLFLQAKLLRAIQEQEITPLGSDQEITVDVRIVAATNRPLPILVAERKFREDLYYRLNVLTIHLPPLRERAADIPLLVEAFCREQGYIEHVSPDAMRALLRYQWPGNIRELHNVIAQCAVFAESATLQEADLPETVRGPSPRPAYGFHLPEEGFSLNDAMQEIERRFILQALARTGGNRTQAARLLGIPRPTLFHRIQQLQLEGVDHGLVENRGMDWRAMDAATAIAGHGRRVGPDAAPH